MSTTIPATTVTHNVGTCPACRDYLWAEVDIEVVVGVPTMQPDGKVGVYASPRVVAMSVEHSCWTDDEGVRQTGSRP